MLLHLLYVQVVSRDGPSEKVVLEPLWQYLIYVDETAYNIFINMLSTLDINFMTVIAPLLCPTGVQRWTVWYGKMVLEPFFQKFFLNNFFIRNKTKIKKNLKKSCQQISDNIYKTPIKLIQKHNQSNLTYIQPYIRLKL